jgi:hypothetical protein
MTHTGHPNPVSNQRHREGMPDEQKSLGSRGWSLQYRPEVATLQCPVRANAAIRQLGQDRDCAAALHTSASSSRWLRPHCDCRRENNSRRVGCKKTHPRKSTHRSWMEGTSKSPRIARRVNPVRSFAKERKMIVDQRTPALQSSNRNDLTRQGRAGILAGPNAFDATHRSGT